MVIQDPEFPGLRDALDVGRVVEDLRMTLPECQHDLSLLGGTIIDVRYRRGGPCWVLYKIKVRDGRRSSSHLMAGRVLRDREEPDPVPDALLARYRRRDEFPIQTVAARLPHVPLVLYPYPIDTSLPGLVDASDPLAIRQHLNRLFRHRGTRVRRVHIESLGYTPHARAALSYELLNEVRATGVPEMRRLIGKMHAKKDAARLFADQWAIWRAARGRLGLAPPVGYLGEINLTLQEQVRGQRLGGLVSEGGFKKWLRKTARMLAALHGLQVPVQSRRSPEQEVLTIHRWAGVLETIRPDLARDIRALRDAIAQQVATHAQVLGPIHADFHHTNVLVEHDDVTIIDFDEMAIGDAMVDVGRFLASLRVPSRRVFGSVTALNEAGDIFLDEYLRRSGGAARRARLFEAASLLIAGGSAFRIQRPTWREEVSELIAEAERVFALAHPAMPAKQRQDGKNHRLDRTAARRWAADGVYMQAALAPSVRTAFDVELTECRVITRNASRSKSRFEYDVRGWRGEEEWRATLQGVIRTDGGRSLLRRLDTLRDKLTGCEWAPSLPRPVAYLGRLSLTVCQGPAGERLPSLLGSATAVAAAQQLGQALARLHEAPVELGCAPRTLERHLESVRGRIAEIPAAFPLVRDHARRVLEELQRQSRSLPVRLAPVLRHIYPQHVLWAGQQVGLQRVDDVTLSHPYLDVGDCLARLSVLALADGHGRAWSDLADAFRSAYQAAATRPDESLAVFEAEGLLRMSCRAVRKAPDDAVAHLLLERAEARLAA